MPRFPALLLCLVSVVAANAQISVTGLGVRLEPEPADGWPVVGAVVANSPADEANLKAGDRLTEIDGRPVRWTPVANVLKLLRGAGGEPRVIGVAEPARRVTLIPRPLRGIPLAGDCENGTGTFQDLDGSTYKGRFVGGRYHGKGELTYLDGRRYEGEFVDGKFHGYGSEDWPTGDHYEGEFRAGRADVRGTYWYAAHRESYTGEFKAGRPHGQGQLTLHHTSTDFSGTFADGEPVTGELSLREGGARRISPGSREQLRLAAVALRREREIDVAGRKAREAAARAAADRQAAAERTLTIDAPAPEPPTTPARAAATARPPTASAPAPKAACTACAGTGHEIERCGRCQGSGIMRSERRYPKTVETPYSRSVWDSTGHKLIGQESGYQRRTETIVQISEQACPHCEKSSGFVITKRACKRCGGSGVAAPAK